MQICPFSQFWNSLQAILVTVFSNLIKVANNRFIFYIQLVNNLLQMCQLVIKNTQFWPKSLAHKETHKEKILRGQDQL